MKIMSDLSGLPNTVIQKTSQLADTAQQFEASMLQELLKPVQDNNGDWGGDTAGDSSLDTLRGFGTEAVAKSISERGGFGIAKQIISQITAEHERVSGKR